MGMGRGMNLKTSVNEGRKARESKKSEKRERREEKTGGESKRLEAGTTVNRWTRWQFRCMHAVHPCCTGIGADHKKKTPTREGRTGQDSRQSTNSDTAYQNE